MLKRLLRLFMGSCLILLAVAATHDLSDRLIGENVSGNHLNINELQAVITKILHTASSKDYSILDFQRSVSRTQPVKNDNTFPKVQFSLKYCYFRYQLVALLIQNECKASPATRLIKPECTGNNSVSVSVLSPVSQRYLFRLTANAPPR